MKRKKWTWRQTGTLFFCVVTLFALTVFCVRVGKGISQVKAGKMTPAQVIEEMGEWLRGEGE